MTQNKLYYDDVAGSVGYLNPLFKDTRNGLEADHMVTTFSSETLGNYFYGYIDKSTGTNEVGIIPAYSLLTGCITIATTAFDGNITIDIGDAGDVDGILPNANITKTLNAVSGEDPATYGAYLWQAGSQPSGGAVTGGSQTKTPTVIGTGSQTLDAATPDFTVTAWPSITTPDNWTVVQPTMTTQPTIATWAHPKQKLYTMDTLINATVVKGTTTVGMLVVYIFYQSLRAP